MEHIVYKDTIPYIPAIESGKVIKVYDGDTITIATKLPHDNEHVYRFSVRLRGIDCPEMRKADEKEKAILARDFVSQRIMHKNGSIKRYRNRKIRANLSECLLRRREYIN